LGVVDYGTRQEVNGVQSVGDERKKDFYRKIGAQRTGARARNSQKKIPGKNRQPGEPRCEELKRNARERKRSTEDKGERNSPGSTTGENCPFSKVFYTNYRQMGSSEAQYREGRTAEFRANHTFICLGLQRMAIRAKKGVTFTS